MPPSLLLITQSSQHVPKCSVETLGLPIPFGMVGSGPGFLNTSPIAQLLDYFGFKVPPLVAMETNREGIMYNKVV